MHRFAILTLLLLCAPSAARAAAPEALAPVGSDFVALAGPEVLFVSPTTGDVRTVDRVVLRPDAPVTSLAASAQRAAVAAGPVLAGPPAGPYRPYAAARGVAVAGDVVVSVEGDRLVARDPAPVELARSAGLMGRVRAAGPYVAYLVRSDETFALTVLDRKTRTPMLRLTLPREPEDFDVQADGKVVVAVPRTQTATAVSWGQAGRRGLRDVASAARSTRVRIAGDRIAYVRRAGGDAAASELAISDLDGFTEPVTFPAQEIRAFDFDGERLAWSTPDCVYAAELRDLSVSPSPPSGPCRRVAAELVAPESIALGPRRRTLTVEVACPMATAAGCQGELRVTFRRRGAGVPLGRARVAVARGQRRRVTVRVGSRALEAVRERTAERLSVRLIVDGAVLSAARPRLTSPSRAPVPTRPRSGEDGEGGEFVIG